MNIDSDIRTLDEIAETPHDETVLDWRRKTPDELIDHLLATHHEFTRSELHRAIALAANVRSVHGAQHPELHEVHDRVEELRVDLVSHLAKEEQVLFPWIRRDAAGVTSPTRPGFPITMPVHCMEEEHEAVGEILARLRELTNGYTAPPDACGSFRALYQSLADLEADLHVHIRLENDVLFPAALARATLT